MVVLGVEPNSAASKAGLKADDVLVKINHQSVPSDAAFTKLVQEQKVDQAADLVVVRNGKERRSRRPRCRRKFRDSEKGRRPGRFRFPEHPIQPAAAVNPLQPGHHETAYRNERQRRQGRPQAG